MRGDDELIERARRLLDNATPGPWAPYYTIHGEPFVTLPGLPITHGIAAVSVSSLDDSNDDYGRANAEFIAAAPELVSGLLAEVERLREWKDSAMSVLSEWDNVHDALGRPGHLGASKALASHFEVERLRGELLELGGKLPSDRREALVATYAYEAGMEDARGELAARSDTEPDTCPTCGGTWKVVIGQHPYHGCANSEWHDGSGSVGSGEQS